MSIVLKENDWAEKKIEECDLGKKSPETLRRVARYYLDGGFSKSQTLKKMSAFITQCTGEPPSIKWEGTIDWALKAALKCPAIDIDCIEVTDAEMKKIDALDGKQIKRLAFTLVCLAKYWLIVNPNCEGWVKDNDNQIMQLANINTSLKRQGLMYWKLREAGMIQLSKMVDNTSIKVLFAQKGTPVMKITDFRNLGYQYLMYHKEPYYECVNCGLTTKIAHPDNNSKPKYCKECASKIQMKQIVNSIMRRRKEESIKNK